MQNAAPLRSRPKYLSARALLVELRLPLPGWVSILHRISGLLLVGVCLWLAGLLDRSLSSQEAFDEVALTVRSPAMKALALVVFWSYAHHFFAGLRFLALDFGRGVNLRAARVSSLAVIVLSLSSTAAVAWKLWR